MVDWTSARAFTEQACAEIFDVTPCRLQPRAPGATVNHGEVDDGGRGSFEFLGTIDLEPPADRLTRHMSVDTGTRSGAVSYDAVLTALTTGWPYQPRRGDHVISGGATWKIVANEQDGSNRPAWYLNKA